jgi:hypothetical protein
MRKHLIVFFVLLLSSCSVVPVSVPRVAIDPELLKPCAAQTALVANPTPTQVLQQHMLNTLSYQDCAIRHAKLVALVQSFTITEEIPK